MTFIYAIYVHGECYYIGQTKNTEKRFKQHRDDILKQKHSVKALNKVDIKDVDMRVVCTLHTDNSFLICIVEGLYNSIYKPKNGITWVSGRNTVRFKRIDCKLAEKLLQDIENNV